MQLKVVCRDFPGGPVVKTLPSWIKPMQEAQVLSRELRFHMLRSAAKKKKKKKDACKVFQHKALLELIVKFSNTTSFGGFLKNRLFDYLSLPADLVH